MTSPLIEVVDLRIGWSEDAVLLEHVTFDVARGEVFAILGTSGSGKSTLLRSLLGLSPPLSGKVTIDGEAPELDGHRPRFGVMFQQGALIGSMTVLENVALPLSLWVRVPECTVLAMAAAKLRLVGLEGTESKLPAELSGGMTKRAAIARALALESSLLFLDEPTAGLDPITAKGIDDLILDLNQSSGVTVVLVTHEIRSVLRIAHRAIRLDAAARAIIAEGRPSELAKAEDPRVRGFFAPERRAA
jgi:phospholipid/cholesterol/gamma-HCH transport system ATP-binding protein